MILDILQRSRATEPFRAAVERFLRDGRANDRVVFNPGAPAVKVERTLTKALLEYQDLPLESVEIRGTSGCEYFRGELVVRTADEAVHVAFCWDCKWRAEQAGWSDWFNFPDQARAAREFGWDCFRDWTELTRDAAMEAAGEPDAVLA